MTIRQYRNEGGYLHSHSHLYPEGSKQQQVTTYHHRDDNNNFLIRRPFVVNETYKVKTEDETKTLNRLKHGDIIRLEHIITGRFLHSHPVQPPIADKDHNYEVSGYGMHSNMFSDLNDNWRIEIVNENGDPVGRPNQPINAVTDKIRLVHQNIGCVLNCANRALPEWGFKQSEVTCGRETLKTNSIWFIETNSHPNSTNDIVYKTCSARGCSHGVIPKGRLLEQVCRVEYQNVEHQQGFICRSSICLPSHFMALLVSRTWLLERKSRTKDGRRAYKTEGN